MGTYPWGGARTSYTKGERRVQPLVLHEPIPLVDLALPVEGVDLLGRHGGRVGRGGRHGAGGRSIGRGREEVDVSSQRLQRLEADGVGVSWTRSEAVRFVVGISAQPLGKQIYRLFNMKYT